MKNIIVIIAMFIGLTAIQGQEIKSLREKFEKVEFTYKKLPGIGYEEGVTRRDPSDVIEVNGKYYVYYTKVIGQASGYWGDL